MGSRSVINIGSRKQLFLDERLIESSRGVRLEINTPHAMREPVLVADQRWENPEDSFVWSYSSLARVDGKTRLTFRHSAMGLIEEAHREGLTGGWMHYLENVRAHAEKRG